MPIVRLKLKKMDIPYLYEELEKGKTVKEIKAVLLAKEEKAKPKPEIKQSSQNSKTDYLNSLLKRR